MPGKASIFKQQQYVNSHPAISFAHLNLGGTFTKIFIGHKQLRCTKHYATKGSIFLLADGHHITVELIQYGSDPLASNNYTNKYVSVKSGLDRTRLR